MEAQEQEQEDDLVPGDTFITNIHGDISGMFAVGKNITQLKVDVEAGGRATIIQPDPPLEIHEYSVPVQVLPKPFDNLLDRNTETGHLAADLLSRQPVEFFGGEGFGKTTLLRAAAYHPVASAFPDGVVYLEMRDKKVEDLLKELYDVFYETSRPFHPGEVNLRRSLSTKKALILIDEVTEQRQASEVQSLVIAAPACTFLFASEEQRLLGEGCAYELSGLPPADSLKLFEQQVGHALSPAEMPLVMSICANLKGNPQHVIQAAGLAKKYPAALVTVAAQMAEANPVKRLKNVLLASLAPEEQQVIAALAALRGAPVNRKHLPGLTRRASALAILAALLERGIVQAHGAGVSLSSSMLSEVTLRMDLSPARDEALRYFTRLAERQFANPAVIFREAQPLQALIHAAAENGQWAQAFHLARLTERALALAGHWGAWGDVLQVAYKAAVALGDLPGQGWALHQLGTRDLCLGNDAAARSNLIRALRLRQSLNDQAGIEVSRHNLSLLLPPPVDPPSRNTQVPVTGEGMTQAIQSEPRPFSLALVRGLLAAISVIFIVAAGAGAVFGWPSPPAAPTQPAPALPPQSTATAAPLITLTPQAQAPVPPVTLTVTSTTTSTVTPTRTATATSTPTITVTTCVPVQGWSSYVIRPGDTLSRLAAETGTSVAALMRANCLATPQLLAGNTISVPVPPQIVTPPTPTPQQSLPDLVIQSAALAGPPVMDGVAMTVPLTITVKDQSTVPVQGGKMVYLTLNYKADIGSSSGQGVPPFGASSTTFSDPINANSTVDVPLQLIRVNPAARQLFLNITVNSCPTAPAGTPNCGLEESDYSNNSLPTTIQLPPPPLVDLAVQAIDQANPPEPAGSSMIISLYTLIGNQSSTPFQGGQDLPVTLDYQVDTSNWPKELPIPADFTGHLTTSFSQGIEANASQKVLFARFPVNALAGGRSMKVTVSVNICGGLRTAAACWLEESNYGNNTSSTQIQLPALPTTVIPTPTP